MRNLSRSTFETLKTCVIPILWSGGRTVKRPPALCRTSAFPVQSTTLPAMTTCLPPTFSTRTPERVGLPPELASPPSTMASTTQVPKRHLTPCFVTKASATRLKGSLVRFRPSLYLRKHDESENESDDEREKKKGGIFDL